MRINKIILILFLGVGLLLNSCQSSEDDQSQADEDTTAVNTLTETEEDEGWTLLFDGEDPSEH